MCFFLIGIHQKDITNNTKNYDLRYELRKKIFVEYELQKIFTLRYDWEL